MAVYKEIRPYVPRCRRKLNLDLKYFPCTSMPEEAACYDPNTKNTGKCRYVIVYTSTNMYVLWQNWYVPVCLGIMKYIYIFIQIHTSIYKYIPVYVGTLQYKTVYASISQFQKVCIIPGFEPSTSCILSGISYQCATSEREPIGVNLWFYTV